MNVPKTVVKILHAGDLHMDSPFPGLSAEKSARRRQALRDCFSGMMEYVRRESVDLVLLSGDLYDRDYVTNETVDHFLREFKSCPMTHFVIAPGNHDPRTPKSIYASGRFGSNVHFFEDEILTRIDFDHLGTAVYGWAFTGDTHRFSPLAKKKATPGFLNLLCGHCDLDRPGSLLCPVMSRDIELFGADYGAFSHRHATGGFKTLGRTVYSYSGCLDHRSFEESGLGGANLVVATAAEAGWQISARRVTFGRHRYVWELLDVTGELGEECIRERIRQAVSRTGADENTLVRVDLVGSVPPGAHLPLGQDLQGSGVFFLEVRDRTEPTFGEKALLRDMTARGQLYRSLLPKIREGTPEERAEASAALRVGLSALSGGDIAAI